MKELTAALELAMPDGILLPFAENGDYVSIQLRELQRKGVWPEKIDSEAGGKFIGPSGKVAGGSRVVFTTEPEEGYCVAYWMVNEERVTRDAPQTVRLLRTDLSEDYSGATYTVDSLVDNLKVQVVFAPVTTPAVFYSIAAEPTSNGSVSWFVQPARVRRGRHGDPHRHPGYGL